MLYRNMFLNYYSEAGEDGAAGGGNVEPVKTYTQAEVDEMTRGLRESRDALLTEKKTASAKAKEAEQARIAAEQERAKQAGKLDEFEKTIRSQYEPVIAERDAKLNALTSRVTSAEKKAILSSFSADFIAPESLDLVAQLVKTEFDGSEVKTQFTDFAGNVITTDAAEFKKWMSKHPAISHLMKADSAFSGGGANGNNGKGGANTSTKFAALKDLPVR